MTSLAPAMIFANLGVALSVQPVVGARQVGGESSCPKVPASLGMVLGGFKKLAQEKASEEYCFGVMVIMKWLEHLQDIDWPCSHIASVSKLVGISPLMHLLCHQGSV